MPFRGLTLRTEPTHEDVDARRAGAFPANASPALHLPSARPPVLAFAFHPRVGMMLEKASAEFAAFWTYLGALFGAYAAIKSVWIASIVFTALGFAGRLPFPDRWKRWFPWISFGLNVLVFIFANSTLWTAHAREISSLSASLDDCRADSMSAIAGEARRAAANAEAAQRAKARSAKAYVDSLAALCVKGDSLSAGFDNTRHFGAEPRPSEIDAWVKASLSFLRRRAPDRAYESQFASTTSMFMPSNQWMNDGDNVLAKTHLLYRFLEDARNRAGN